MGNLLTINQASFETDTSGWVGVSNVSNMLRVSAEAYVGTYSMRVDGATFGISTFVKTSIQASITPGATYTALARFVRPGATGGARLGITFYSADEITTETRWMSMANTASSWKAHVLTEVAPAWATKAGLEVEFIALSGAQSMYIDATGIMEGADTTWAIPEPWPRKVSSSRNATWNVLGPNLLTYNNATFEGAPIQWALDTNASALTRSTAQAAEGSYSLAVTCGTSGHMKTTLGTVQANAIPVIAGQQYTILASLRFGSGAPRDGGLLFVWYNAAFDFLSFQNHGAAIAGATTTGWTQGSATQTAPANAAYLQIVLEAYTVVAGTNVYWDKVSVAQGTSTVWSSPPLPTTSTYENYSAAVMADTPTVRLQLSGSSTTEPFAGAGGKYHSAASTAQVVPFAPGAAGVSGTWSVEFWAKPDGSINPAVAAWGVSTGTWPNNTIILYAGDTVDATSRVYWGATRVPRVDATLLGAWNHYVFVNEGATLRQYINGVQVASGSPGGAFTPAYGVIGGGGGNNDQRFKGDLSQVAIYDQALSAARVAAHFTAASMISVESSIASEWAVESHVERSLTSTWDITGAVASSKAAEWSVRAPVVTSKPLEWNTQETIATSRSIDWNILTSVESLIDSDWDIREVIQRSFDTEWDVTGRVSTPIQSTFDVLTTLSSNKNLDWNVYTGGPTSSISSEWDIRATIATSKALEWGVGGSLSVPLSTSWTVNEVVSRQQEMTFAVRQALQRDLDLEWALLSRAELALVLEWTVIQNPVASLNLRWRVEQTISGLPDVTVGLGGSTGNKNLAGTRGDATLSRNLITIERA